MFNKIFLIGSNKTGTTSVKVALNQLGFSVLGEAFAFDLNSTILLDFQKGKYENLFNIVEKYDAFKDRPWNHTDFYKLLDFKFPNSKFILTIRTPENWIQSNRRWSKKISLSEKWFYKIISQTCYGVDDFLSNENIMIEKYNKRNNEIIEHFKSKNNLLIMNLEENDGWDVLCPFLEKEIVKNTFPHKNKTKKR